MPDPADAVSRSGKGPVFAHIPDAAAVAAIQGKLVMLPAAFKMLLPELRARAFTVAGIQDMAALDRIHKKVAEVVTKGREWKTVRGELADEMTEFLGKGAEARAQLLLRTHAFQAYATARYQEQTAQADIVPWWQYVTCGDNSVRETHAALDGRVFRHDDEFWGDHYPPWDFGCRCIVIACMDDEVAAMREADANLPPIARRVLEGDALESARKGLVSRGVGDITAIDITQDYGKDGEGKPISYKWNPTHQGMTLGDIKYPPEILQPFVERWKETQIGDGRSVLDWLQGKAAPAQPPAPTPKPKAPPPPAAKPGDIPAMTIPPAWKSTSDSAKKQTPVPAPQPIPGAIKPVSAAIQIKTDDKGVSKSVKTALDAIAKTHQDGNLPQLQLTADNRMKPLGQYSAKLNGNDSKIKINDKKGGDAFTVAHEIGHFIDHQGLTPETKGLGYLSGRPGGDTEMDKLMDAIKSSPSYNRIAETKILKEADKSYLMDSRELFARAYAQYVAVESKDREMMRELNKARLGPAPFTQWDDKGFAPIKTAMTELFKARGWKT
jgi:SPP1 gp7 family putative phage head morphogenesis protein